MQTPSPAAAPPFDWSDARVLAALLHRGSFSAAGAALGVHPATVARRLEALESALGGRLFDLILDVASGTQTKSEQLGVGEEEFAPWTIGPTL